MMPASVVLPSPGGPGEQQVVGRLAPPAGGLEHDVEVVLELGLADELGQPPRAAGVASAATSSSSGPGPGSSSSSRIGGRLGVGPRSAASGPAVIAAPPTAQAWRSMAARRRRPAGRPWRCGSRRPSSPARRAPPARRSSRRLAGPRRGRRATRPRPARPRVGDVEAGLQLDQQPGRGLLAHPGHQAQGGDVVVGQDADERRRACTDRMAERQRRPDAVGAEQRLERDLLVAGREAVERLGVLPDVVVDPHEHLVADLAERRPPWWATRPPRSRRRPTSTSTSPAPAVRAAGRAASRSSWHPRRRRRR